MSIAMKTDDGRRLLKEGRGRPSKLTEETIAVMCEHFRLGLNARRVCDLVMVSEQTFYQWIRIANADIVAGVKANKHRGHFVYFLESIRRAQAEWARDHLKAIASNPDWRARAWALERISPDEFGPKDRKSEEVEKPRPGLVVDAEAVNPIHAILDEAKRRGGDWLLLALETLRGVPLGAGPLPALPPAEVEVSPPPT